MRLERRGRRKRAAPYEVKIWNGICFAHETDEGKVAALESMLGAVGNTPLVRLSRIAEGLRPQIFAKAEFLNPGGSVKDRIGLRMLLDAERRGLIKKGGTIVEPTSGNTGTALAIAASLRGYRAIFVMSDKMSADKERLLRAYGAEVIRTPAAAPHGDPRNYYSVAEELSRKIPGAFCPNQYYNLQNPQAHYETTGPEIWDATGGKITHFVAGMGTGGTISGVARYLKEKNPQIRVVGVDADGSIYGPEFYGAEGQARPYKVEGIGADFTPDTIDLSLVDTVLTIGDRESFLTARRLAREELLAGGSSGAAVAGALLAARGLDESARMVVLLPDTGRNYLSTIYSDEWMAANGFLEAPAFPSPEASR